MRSRLSILSLAAATVVIGILHGCHSQDDCWPPPRSIELGVGSNLHAVAPAAERDSGHSAIAVGSAGTVVAWGYRNDELFVETSTVGDVDLRGVAGAGAGRWVVVGDGGFAAVSDDFGQTWTTLDLGTSADLHAAFVVSQSVVVVGDEVVRVVAGDNTWLEPAEVPDAGWGQLRAGGSSYAAPYPSEDPRTYAVGLGGVIVSTTDPSGVWVAEDSGVSVDLFGVGPLQWLVAAVGADGTFLVREAGEWSPIETERTTDFVDYLNFDPFGVVLAADGELLQCDQYDLSEGFQHLDRLEGARDLVAQPFNLGLIVVGDAGLAVSLDYVWPGGY